MSHVQPRQYFASTQRAVANADAIEWEDMPSLTKRLVNRGANDSRFQNSTSPDPSQAKIFKRSARFERKM